MESELLDSEVRRLMLQVRHICRIHLGNSRDLGLRYVFALG